MSPDLDHIIWVCDDLARGCSQFSRVTGVTPQFGGVHASGLTQNALVRLGDRLYLEILGPVGAPGPNDDQWTQYAHAASQPHVLTYCMRSPRPLRELAYTAEAHGWTNSAVAANGRERPDGVKLHWQWLAPAVERFGLAFPFFIDWLDSPHPTDAAATSDQVGLRQFSVGHPLAGELTQALADCAVAVETFESPVTCFRVELDTPRGPVVL